MSLMNALETTSITPITNKGNVTPLPLEIFKINKLNCLKPFSPKMFPMDTDVSENVEPDNDMGYQHSDSESQETESNESVNEENNEDKQDDNDQAVIIIMLKETETKEII